MTDRSGRTLGSDAVTIGVAICERGPDGETWRLPAGADDLVERIAELARAGLFGFVEHGLGDAPWLRRPARPSLASWHDARPGPRPWAEAVEIGHAIATSLALAEQHGAPASPLHPDTIAKGDDAVVVLADAWLRALVGAPPDVAGSSDGRKLSRWIAPEQAEGAPWDHAANRYVLGLVLYKLLAGSHPFSGKGLRHAFSDQLQRGAPPLPDAIAHALPPGLQSFVLRCLDPDPRARPDSAAAIAERLAAIRSGTPISSGAVAVVGVTTPEPPVRLDVAPAPPSAPVVHTAIAPPTSARTQLAIPPRVKPRSKATVAIGRTLSAALPIALGLGLAAVLVQDVAAPPAAAKPTVGDIAPLDAAHTRPDDCATCHPSHTAQWHLSVMAHSVKSPLFQSLEMLIQEQAGREFGCDGGAGILRASDGRTACRDRVSGLPVTGSGGALWCVNCHAPGENLAASVPAWNGISASSSTRKPLRDLLPAGTMEGISCAFCHQVHGPVRPGDGARGGYEGNPEWFSTTTGERFSMRPEDGQGRFGIANSGYSLDPFELLAKSLTGVDIVGSAHVRPSAEAKAYLASSDFCGACHDVRLFGSDVLGARKGEHFKRLRNAYSEWRSWAALERAAGRTPASCQDCHMSTYPGVCEATGDAAASLSAAAAGNTALARACPPGTTFSPRSPGDRGQGLVATASGTATELAPHYFTGVDIPLADAFPDALVDDGSLDANGIPLGARQRRDLLLGRTFRFELGEAARRGGRLEIPIELENTGAGHRVPAGFSQEREFWVHLVVTDADGRVLYEVGRVDRGDEDLRDKIFLSVTTDDGILDGQGRPQGMFGADIVDGPDVQQWSPNPITGATTFRGKGLVNLQNGFLRCVTCIGEIDALGRCQPGVGQGRHRADRFADGQYDIDTGECISNLSADDALFETFFPVGALDATRGVTKGPDAIVDTRSAPPGVPLRYTYELDVANARGPIQVEARLLFRAFPPFLVKAFADYEARQAARGLRPSGPLVTREMLDRLEVVELHRVRSTVP